MAHDFKKILDHPEVQTIIDKLTMGEKPKDVSEYLRSKFDAPDEGHLRLSIQLLEQFTKNYLSTSSFLDKIVKDSKTNSLDKQISQSLLNNKTWKNRLAELADEKIDVEKKLVELMTMLENRAEQIFDKIQENPGNTKLDYVMTKYFELISLALEKYDKIANKAPDQRIEHTYTVQLVEQHSNAFQEAIRRSIARLPAEFATEFMGILAEEMQNIKPPQLPVAPTVKAITKDVEIIGEKIHNLDLELEEVDNG